MRVLVVGLAVLAVLAALPLAKGHGEEEGGAALAKVASGWPCCDRCDTCLLYTAICRCADTSPSRCNPACKKCVKISGRDGVPVFQCKDQIAKFCNRRCTLAAAAGA